MRCPLLLVGLFALSVSASSLAQDVPSTAPALEPLPVITTLIKDRDFRVLPKALPTSADPNGKEVIIFFYYNSPWSAQAAKYLKAWEDEAGPDVRFTWSPAVLADSWAYGARVFFALDLLDRNPSLTYKLIEAYAQKQVIYGDTASLERWLSGQGVTPAQFDKAIDDDKVITRSTWVPPVMSLYTVQSVPSIVINGKYMVEGSADSNPALVVARARYIVDHAGPATASP